MAGNITGQDTLSTSAELVVGANPHRLFAEVKNADNSISMYVGFDSALTTSNGHLLKAGEGFGFEHYTGPIYMIAASGTPTATYIEWSA